MRKSVISFMVGVCVSGCAFAQEIQGGIPLNREEMKEIKGKFDPSVLDGLTFTRVVLPGSVVFWQSVPDIGDRFRAIVTWDTGSSSGNFVQILRTPRQ
jgi:hypothetical protein